MTRGVHDGPEVPVRGRPPATNRREVERVALELFARHGFEATTMAGIAQSLGVGRRTLFRYFPSKNDIVWGDFDLVLARLRDLLDVAPAEIPIMPALSAAVVESNRYEGTELGDLRIRMALITRVPALQAHSMLRYRAWRHVVAEFVAGRRGEPPGGLVPRTIAYVALGTSMAAFSQWVANPEDDLDALLERAFGTLDGRTTVNLPAAGSSASRPCP